MRADDEWLVLLTEKAQESGLSRAEVVKRAVEVWEPPGDFELTEGEKQYVRLASVASRAAAVAATREPGCDHEWEYSSVISRHRCKKCRAPKPG